MCLLTRSRKSTQHRSDVDIAHRLSNLTNQCLDAISKYVDESDLSSPDGRFAPQFFTFSSCAAELYLSLGKRETAKNLFSAAISHIRTTQVEELGDSSLMRLLRDFAACCSKTGDLTQAEEALKSALVIAETTLGHMSDETVEIASRLRAVSESIATELEHSKRALVASTGNKLSRLDGRLESDNPGPGTSMIPSDRKVTLKPEAESDLLRPRTTFEKGVDCQLLLGNPTLIIQRPGPAPTLDGTIRLQVSKAVQVGAVTITLLCLLLSEAISEESSEDGDQAQVLWFAEKHVPLQEFGDFDLKSVATGTPQTRSSIRSLLARVQYRPTYFRRFSKGVYICPFKFKLSNGASPTSQREIQWSLHATFRKPRPFATPFLERFRRIYVLIEPKYRFMGLESNTMEGRWKGQMLKITVSDNGGKGVFQGTQIPVKIHFSNFDGFPRPFSLRFTLKQVKNLQKPYTRELPLSDIPDWTNFKTHFWIPIASQTDSMPVSKIIYLQLPTCKQLRQPGPIPLTPALGDSAFVEHYLEVATNSD